jgi:hypothetical protein
VLIQEVRYLFILLFISIWGIYISAINGIFQLLHLKVVLNFIVFFFVSQSIVFFCKKNTIDFYKLLKIISFIVFINSVVILLEVIFPELKDIIESFLKPAGNIDWAQSFRHRGLASSGGASLSIIFPVSSIIVFYLFKNDKINFLFLILFISVYAMACVFVGRTGLVLMLFVIFVFILLRVRTITSFYLLLRFLFCLVLLYFLTSFLFNYYQSIVLQLFGHGFVKYAYGFLSEGSSWFASDASGSVVLEYLTRFPVEFPYVLSGYGFFGYGDERIPGLQYTDSGLVRIFLSVGWLLGIMHYVYLSKIYVSNLFKHKILIYSIFIVLLIAELKEPLLMSQYSARIFILLVVYVKFESFSQVAKPIYKNAYSI